MSTDNKKRLPAASIFPHRSRSWGRSAHSRASTSGHSSTYPDDTVFVDLFGGSGLLSHITKSQKPHATVIYNDFDGYTTRLRHIPQTNRLLADLRNIAEGMPRHQRILARLEQEEREEGYVDYITVSSSLAFSMKYKKSLPEMRKETLYNTCARPTFRPPTITWRASPSYRPTTRSCSANTKTAPAQSSSPTRRTSSPTKAITPHPET